MAVVLINLISAFFGWISEVEQVGSSEKRKKSADKFDISTFMVDIGNGAGAEY